MTDLIYRKEAKEKGLNRYFTGKPCKRGHICERVTNNCHCVECYRDRGRKYYYNNKKEFAKYNKRNLEYYHKNKYKLKSKRKKYYEENKDRYQKWHKDHYKNNKYLYNEKRSKRRAKKLQAIPSWANLEKIKEIYKDCRRISQETGIKHHVDHIIPLQGKNVSGLHVENNLQIITAEENLSKGNRLVI